MSSPAGRRADLMRLAWAMRFGITHRVHNSDDLRDALLRQLSFCKSDEARRLILGIKPKETHDQST